MKSPFVTHQVPDLARRRAALAMLGGATLPLALGAGACSRREQAPGFDYTLLDGSRHSSAGLQGRVWLVNFWATSCASCVREMPALAALHQRLHPHGLQTLAVAMPYDPPAWVSRFAQARALPFGVVIDPTGAIARGFGDVRVTPTTVVVDRQGGVAARHVGALDFAALQAQLERLLAAA